MIGFGQKTGLYGTAGHEDGATAEEILSYNQFTPPLMPHIDPKMNVDLWLFSYAERNMRGTQPMFTDRKAARRVDSGCGEQFLNTWFSSRAQSLFYRLPAHHPAPPCSTLLTERLRLQDLYNCSEGSVASF